MNQVLVYTIFSFALTACGGGGSTNAVLSQDPGAAPAGNQQTTESLTYYTLVQNLTVTQGGSSYPVTVTGHCVEYETNDYCWDDGWQIPTGLTTTYEHDFWGLCNNSGTIEMCSGGATIDPSTTPHLWTSMVGYMPTPLHHPSDVYTGGIATNVTCTLTGSVLDCGDFQIDTSDASL